MPVNLKRLSEITASVTSPSSSDQLVGVQSGNDVLFNVGDVGGRKKLSADANYFVSLTGNDSNDGVILPWATVQHAANFISKNIDIASFHINVNIGAGSFVGVDIPTFIGGGEVQFLGAGSANTTITNSTAGPCFTSHLSGNQTQVGINKVFIHATGGQPCIFNYSSPSFILTGDLQALVNDDIKFDSNEWALQTGGSGGCVTQLGGSIGAGTHTFAPSFNPFGWIFTEFDTPVILTGNFVTSGTPAWRDAAVRTNTRATIVNNAANFTGAATGLRYDIAQDSVVADNLGGVHYFPGDTEGAIDGNSTYGIASQQNMFQYNSSDGALGVTLYNYTIMNSTSAQNFVVTSAANMAQPFPVGSGLPFPLGVGFEAKVLQKGPGVVTIVADTGVTVHNAGAMPGGQYSEIRLRQLAIDEWVMIT